MLNRTEMLEVIERNMEIIGFPEEAADTFVCVYNHIIEREEEFDIFSSSVEKYRLNKDVDMESVFAEIKASAERLAIHEYTMYMLLFLAMADAMRDHYDKAGIDRKIFVSTLKDLKNQLNSCLDLYGIWGHSSPVRNIAFLRNTELRTEM